MSKQHTPDRMPTEHLLPSDALDEWVSQAPRPGFSDRTAERLHGVWRAARTVAARQVIGELGLEGTIAVGSDCSADRGRRSSRTCDATISYYGASRIRPVDAKTLLLLPSLWEAAVELDANTRIHDSLAGVWQMLLERGFSACVQGYSTLRSHIVGRVETMPGAWLNRIETCVLIRVLCGEPPKVIAAELGIAQSTASKWYHLALAKWQLTGEPFPLPLVIAAQSWASGTSLRVDARVAFFEHEGTEFFAMSVPRPHVPESAPLTLAEREVAELLIEGFSRLEIATCRSTSTQTVARELRGLFGKLQISGRHALIRRSLELGWFC